MNGPLVDDGLDQGRHATREQVEYLVMTIEDAAGHGCGVALRGLVAKEETYANGLPPDG